MLIQGIIGLLNGNGEGQIVVEGNRPTDVILDKKNTSLIISELGNERIVRWSLENPNDNKQILIENIWCVGLAVNEIDDIYVANYWNHRIQRFSADKIKETLSL